MACTVSNVATGEFKTIPEGSNVVLMPPDIKYFRITASGATEPAADWTESARTSFSGAFQSYVDSATVDFSLTEVDELSDVGVEYDRLHSAVGSTILANYYGVTKLPSKVQAETKTSAFDWTLGPGVANLLPDQNGDYALFVFFRDYQASGGRVGMALFASLAGVAIYTGHQGGFASLVDLDSGDVVWFNNLPLAQGDMRKPEGAERIVKQLLSELTEAK